MFEFKASQGQFGVTAEHGIQESTQSPRCPLPHCTPMSAAPHLDWAMELEEHQGQMHQLCAGDISRHCIGVDGLSTGLVSKPSEHSAEGSSSAM